MFRDHCPVARSSLGQTLTVPTFSLTFDSRILSYAEEFMVDSVTARCKGPVAPTRSTHHYATTVLNSFDQVFVLICLVFSVMTRHLHFDLISPEDIVPEVFWLVQMQFYKLKP